MAIIRPMNEKDYLELEGNVTQCLTDAAFQGGRSVISQDLFGTLKPRVNYERSDIYNASAAIDVDIPIVNPFLAGSTFGVWSAIFRENDINKIANGEIVFDKVNCKELSAGDIDGVTYSEDYLIGGQYVRYLLDNLDVYEAIKEILERIVEKAIKKCFDKDGRLNQYGFIAKGVSGDYHIVADYYFYTEKSELIQSIDEYVSVAINEQLDTYTSRLTLLLAIREDKSALRNQIMDKIVVLPYGYRRHSIKLQMI